MTPIEDPKAFASRILVTLLDGGWNFDSLAVAPSWALSDWLRDHGDDAAADYLRWSELPLDQLRRIDGANREFQLRRLIEARGVMYSFDVVSRRSWGWRVTHADECPTFGSRSDAQAYAALREAGFDHAAAWSRLITANPELSYRC